MERNCGKPAKGVRCEHILWGGEGMWEDCHVFHKCKVTFLLHSWSVEKGWILKGDRGVLTQRFSPLAWESALSPCHIENHFEVAGCICSKPYSVDPLIASIKLQQCKMEYSPHQNLWPAWQKLCCVLCRVGILKTKKPHLQWENSSDCLSPDITLSFNRKAAHNISNDCATKSVIVLMSPT